MGFNLITVGLMLFAVGFSELTASLFKHFKFNYKPFSCSFCLNAWYSIGIAYLYTADLKTALAFIGWNLILRQLLWRHLY